MRNVPWQVQAVRAEWWPIQGRTISIYKMNRDRYMVDLMKELRPSINEVEKVSPSCLHSIRSTVSVKSLYSFMTFPG